MTPIPGTPERIITRTVNSYTVGKGVSKPNTPTSVASSSSSQTLPPLITLVNVTMLQLTETYASFTGGTQQTISITPGLPFEPYTVGTGRQLTCLVSGSFAPSTNGLVAVGLSAVVNGKTGDTLVIGPFLPGGVTYQSFSVTAVATVYPVVNTATGSGVFYLAVSIYDQGA